MASIFQLLIQAEEVIVLAVDDSCGDLMRRYLHVLRRWVFSTRGEKSKTLKPSTFLERKTLFKKTFHELNSKCWSLQFHLNKIHSLSFRFPLFKRRMILSSSSLLFSSSLMLKPHPALMAINFCGSSQWSKRKTRGHCLLRVSAISYQDFIDFSLNETKRHTRLLPSPLQEKYSSMIALDGQTRLEMLSFETPRIRVLRSMSIKGETMQVLDFAAFPKPEFDLPIFCGNFFTAANMNIVVLDLNPLHDVISRRDYKEKYYDHLMPLGLKYTELLPWGGKLTSESIKFFSPIVIWTKFSSSKSKHEILYSAFVEYYKAWLELMEQAVEETDPSQIMSNLEAQHRYLTWRAEKDPGHGVLKRLIGEKLAKDLLRNFLFNGIDELGSKTFLDYFPDYWSDDGIISEKRSIIGKGFETRPWDKNGEFVGNVLRN